MTFAARVPPSGCGSWAARFPMETLFEIERSWP